MDKTALGAEQLLKIAAEHAYCAEYLLKQQGEIRIDEELTVDALLPITTLMYQTFELTLKAFLIHQFRQINQYKSLFELVELNSELGLSKAEIQLINKLSRQQGFRKGVDYALWENRQQLQVFCEDIMALYLRILDIMPLELSEQYR